MPMYTYRCPDCGAEKSGLFKLDAPAPLCENPQHLWPAQRPPVMQKQLSAPGFQVTGKGAYSTRSY